MKIAVLTSDVYDGRVVCQELIHSGKNVRCVLYEKKRKTIKTKLRFFLLNVIGKLRYIRYEDMLLDLPDILVKEVDDINSAESIDTIRRIAPDIIIVTGTRKLDKDIFTSSTYGAINLHTGILPYYRGADSEFWALYNNERDMIGVTIHYVIERLDAGDILLRALRPVGSRDKYSDLRKGNILFGAKKLIEALDLISSGRAVPEVQKEGLSRVYRTCSQEGKRHLDTWTKKWLKRKACFKEFGGDFKVREEVSVSPMVEGLKGVEVFFPRTFCLRIDADEYHPAFFDEYMRLFLKHNDAVTVFVNAYSFSNARSKIVDLKEGKVDIQSHGYYHYTYSDYPSNKYNISRASEFFNKLNIKTKGFAAPMGRWNESLNRALEDEGYEYSSDFSYDYLGYPSYPSIDGRISKLLQIPIFPVAPELFFNNKSYHEERILSYYKRAIDEMISCGIPVIIYAHTSDIPGVASFLTQIVEYAIKDKGLQGMNMTSFNDYWRGRVCDPYVFPLEKKVLDIPNIDFLGNHVGSSPVEKCKILIKSAIDFEVVTPDNELRSFILRRCIKRLLRKVLKERSLSAEERS